MFFTLSPYIEETYNTLKMTLVKLLFSLQQWWEDVPSDTLVPSNLERYDREQICIHKGREYRIPVHIRHGPPKFVHAYDEKGMDVLQDLLPYMGPGQDWFNIPLTPAHLHFDQLVFERRNGEKWMYYAKTPLNQNPAAKIPPA